MLLYPSKRSGGSVHLPPDPLGSTSYSLGGSYQAAPRTGRLATNPEPTNRTSVAADPYVTRHGPPLLSSTSPTDVFVTSSSPTPEKEPLDYPSALCITESSVAATMYPFLADLYAILGGLR